MLWAILSIAGAGLLAPLFVRHLGRGAIPAAIAVPLAWTAVLGGRLAEAFGASPVAETHAWVPSLGYELAFRMDGLSALLTVLILGIGTLVVAYACGSFGAGERLGRFLAYLLVFQASMLGLVLADDLVLLFVFWELTSIFSFLLIGFDHEQAAARTAALRALVVTGGGGLALLAGLLLLGLAGDSFRLSELAADASSHALAGAAFALIALGCFTKSAQWPFSFWLPGAMTAPTAASAYLHAATMVKAGVFLLAKLSPVLDGHDAWTPTLVLVGSLTAVLGAWRSARLVPFKAVLANSTVSSLGVLVIGLGIAGEKAALGVVAYLLAHALFKGALFLIAGTLSDATGVKGVGTLSGLRRRLPLEAAGGAVAALSMAGLPFAFGYVAKEALLAGLLAEETGGYAWVALLAVIMASALGIFAAVRVGILPFVGEERLGSSGKFIAPHPLMSTGPVVLAAATLIFGAVMPFGDALTGAAAATVHGASVAVSLHLWPGFGWVLLASLVTFGSAYFLWTRREAWFQPGAGDPEAVDRRFEALIAGVYSVAGACINRLQDGRLRRYLAITLGTATALVAVALLRSDPSFAMGEMPSLADVMLVALVVAGAAATASGRSAYLAVAGLGAVGYGLGVLYAIYGAPDLAATQFVIESVTVILLVLVFLRLPPGRHRLTGASRWLTLGLSISFGLVVTLLVLATTDLQLGPAISEEHLALAYPEAFGRNVVNVILVDFRGLDTLIEISVLAVVGLGVYSLIKLRDDGVDDGAGPLQAPDSHAAEEEPRP